jgi:hypothetical protein
MTLTMENDLGTLGSAGLKPPDEMGIPVEEPFAMPVRHYQQRGSDVTRRAQAPETANRGGVGWGHIVNRDQQH